MAEPRSGDIPITQEHLDSPPLYRDLLIQVAQDSNRAIDESIHEIELGVFSEIGDDLQRLSQQDPNREEFFRPAFITPAGKLIVKTNAVASGIWGGDHVEALDISPEDISLYGEDARNIIACLPHSHPVDTPPSGRDLFQLLIQSNFKMAQPSAFVSTPRRKIIVFRGPNTPQLSQDGALQKLDSWKNQVNERHGKLTTPGMNAAELVELRFRLETAMARQIVAKYDLRAFSAPNGAAIARVITPDQL